MPTPTTSPSVPDPELSDEIGRIFLPLTLSPVFLSLFSFFCDDEATFITGNRAQEEEVAPEYAVLQQEGNSDTANYNLISFSALLQLTRLLLPLVFTLYSFYGLWKLLRTRFVPCFLMPSTIKNNKQAVLRKHMESNVERAVNSDMSLHSPIIRSGQTTTEKEVSDITKGKYIRKYLDVWDPLIAQSAKLECGIWENKDITARTCNKWIVYLNANGVAYQDILPFTIKYAQSLKASIINVNYQGVNGSTGHTTGETSLLADADRVIRYLHDERGVKMCDILVHGHSMGGAVAICLAVRYADDQLKCVADRTFSQLPLVVGEMLSGMQGLIFGIIFSLAFCWIPVMTWATCIPVMPSPPLPYIIRGIWIACVGIQCLSIFGIKKAVYALQCIPLLNRHNMIMRFSAIFFTFCLPASVVFSIELVPWVGIRLAAFIECLFLINVTGGVCGYLGLLRWPLSRLAELMDWGINPVRELECLHTSPSDTSKSSSKQCTNILVIYHPNDTIIPFKASLFCGLGLHHDKEIEASGGGIGKIGEKGSTSVDTLVLTLEHPNCHMVPLDMNPEIWSNFVSKSTCLLHGR